MSMHAFILLMKTEAWRSGVVCIILIYWFEHRGTHQRMHTKILTFNSGAA